MPRHDVEMSIPTTKMVLHADVVFEVRSDGEKLGTLHISQGTIDWFPASALSMLGYLSDRLRGGHTSMVCTAAPNSGVGSPLIVNAKTGTVAPLASFFDVEGFLAIQLNGFISSRNGVSFA